MKACKVCGKNIEPLRNSDSIGKAAYEAGLCIPGLRAVTNAQMPACTECGRPRSEHERCYACSDEEVLTTSDHRCPGYQPEGPC